MPKFNEKTPELEEEVMVNYQGKKIKAKYRGVLLEYRSPPLFMLDDASSGNGSIVNSMCFYGWDEWSPVSEAK